MGLRQRAQFMPEIRAPGGRIELGDRSMPAAGALAARAEAALMARVRRPSPTRARALALAAIRETYEEGLLLGTREYGAPEKVPDGPWSAFAEHGVFPELESLQVIARAITPPGRPKRFDTRFLAVDRAAIAHEVPGLVGPNSELTELAWVTIAEATRLDLPSITRSILQELEARIAQDFLPSCRCPSSTRSIAASSASSSDGSMTDSRSFSRPADRPLTAASRASPRSASGSA